MEIGRELIAESAIGIGAVVVFVGSLFFLGQRYATNGTLQPQGGLYVVVALGAFVVLLTLAGLWMERQDFDS